MPDLLWNDRGQNLAGAGDTIWNLAGAGDRIWILPGPGPGPGSPILAGAGVTYFGRAGEWPGMGWPGTKF